VAGSGGDTLIGGSGSDLFKVGGHGNDTIQGGGGTNTLEFTHASASDVTNTTHQGSMTTLTFSDGQEVTYSGIQTIKFDH
jgi:hypothetical protein